MGNVKKSVAERTRHQRQYDRRVHKRQLQTHESKIDTGKAVDADLVVIESSVIESEVQDDGSRSGNDTDADDADIRPIYDEERVQLTVECNIFAIGQQHTEQPEIINEGRVDQSKTIEQTTSLLANNADLKAQIHEKVFAIDALKNNLRKLKGHTKKKTQERDRNSKTSVMPSARFQCTADDSKQKPRSNNQTSRSLPVSKSSREVNSHAKIQSHKTRNSNKPVDQKSHTQKPGRQIFTRDRFSPNKTFAVYEKTSTRSDIRWKPTGRIFKSVGLRWIPTGKTFDSCTGKVDSKLTHDSNVDIPNIHESKQTLDLSAVFRCSTADASDKRQQQPDSTSSTSTLETVTADGNFDL
ncbi:hypothetical protein Tco_1134147 [Tanacetum coccineum]